jgi:hypothetical protein
VMRKRRNRVPPKRTLLVPYTPHLSSNRNTRTVWTDLSFYTHTCIISYESTINRHNTHTHSQ